MGAITAQAVGHVVRRSIEAYASGKPQQPHEIPTFALLMTLAVFLFTVLICVSVEYTVGDLMGSLTMIESSETAALIAPPAYSEDADASLEKKGLLEESDVELVLIQTKPITSSIKDTIFHLHRIGGFRARWRGVGCGILYHAALNMAGHGFEFLCGEFVGLPRPISMALGFTVSMVVMCRLRMLWTHSMVAMPTEVPWYKQVVERKRARVLLLPSFIYALAMQATLVTPLVTVGVLSELFVVSNAFAVLAGFMAVAVMASVGFFLAMPASIALTRIETCLLPADRDTVVNFNRESIMGDVDMAARGAPGKLFASAWKSVTVVDRLRIIKLYIKLITFQISFVIMNTTVLAGALYLIGAIDILVMIPAAVVMALSPPQF